MNRAAKSYGARLHSSCSDSEEVRTSRWRSDTTEELSVSLGTDGAIACTPGGIMLAAQYASQTYADPLSPGALLEMQTINAAAAAGLDADLGKPGVWQACRHRGEVRTSG